MSKIPRNLSDKDMLKNYHEEPTMEDMLLAMDAEDDTPTPPSYIRRKPAVKGKGDDDPLAVYLTPAGLDSLVKELLNLKLDLYKDGIVNYRMDVKRVGRTITLTPVETVAKARPPIVPERPCSPVARRRHA